LDREAALLPRVRLAMFCAVVDCSAVAMRFAFIAWWRGG